MAVSLTVVVLGALALVLNALEARVRMLGTPSRVKYLILGAVLGPGALDFLQAGAVEALQPLISLTIGLMGFLLGMSLRRRLAHGAHGTAGAFAACLVVGTVAVVIQEGVGYSGEVPGSSTLWLLSVTLGTMAAVTSASGSRKWLEDRIVRGPSLDLVLAFACVGSVIAVVGFGAAMALFRADQPTGLTPVEWLLIGAASGVGCGLLYRGFIGSVQGDDRVFVATIGVVTFGSGLAAGMHLSPLLVNAIAGITVGAGWAGADRLEGKLMRLVGPAAVVMLVLAGAMWSPPPDTLLVLVPALWIVTRIAAWRLAAPIALRVLELDTSRQAAHAGRGTLVQGPLLVAIAANFAQVVPALGPVVLTVAAAGLLMSDLHGGPSLVRFTVDAGEVEHVPHDEIPEAIADEEDLEEAP